MKMLQRVGVRSLIANSCTRQTKRRKSRRPVGQNSFGDRWRRPAFEILEDRFLLSVAQDLVDQLTPYQSSLNAALDAATSLPLVDTQLANLPDFDAIFQNALSSINAQTLDIATNGHYQRNIALASLAKTFAFDLGLDEFLDASPGSSVSAAINPVLHVGFDYLNGAATLTALETSLDIGFNLSLPNFQATMSFNDLLFAKAVDAGTSFQGNLKFDFDAGGGLTPHFTGAADVNMDLSLSFVDPALNASFNPTFVTTLNLDWGFGAGNQLTIPSIQLANFGLDASSFLDGFLGDIVETAQKFTKPIQPFIDVFQTPVPIISSFGSDETIGTLLLKGAGASEIQQQSFSLMVDIIGAINSIDLSNGAENAVIPFGTITLTGDARQEGFGFNTSQLGGAIDDIFGNVALQGVEDALDGLGNYEGVASASGFAFPLLEHPETVIGSILTGVPEAMFTFSTGRQHFELAPSLGFGIPGIFGIFLEAGIFFDANLTMGYDTAGLIELAQTGDPASLLHGFYFDNSIDTSIPPQPNGPEIRKTGLYLTGLMQIVADVAIVHVSGGLYADIQVELENNSPSDHLALDDIGGKVFDFGGKIYASADLEVSLELPIGPNITLYELNLGYAEILSFEPAPPPDLGIPTTVVDVVDQHTLLLDANKMAAGDRVVKVQPFHDLMVNLPGGGTAEADGIRVDYPGEIYLFVERKNDVTTNYYNLIGLNGAVPDRVSINVTDPFRVFVDEGAANPYPSQTKPGVLMVGGKDVLYKYNEFPDGTQPIVLMVGGYGSNTLSGGTMMFGNFIPGDRIAQAKGHFADVTGYDGAGQAYINSVIDAAIAPADPTGIISATMTASRGGLMFGGPGNNSFFAAGPGAYEMIGGNWVNTFNISPSFGGQPATYQIDGGGGESTLVVRVPAGETADFENGTVPDNYDPTFKALDIHGNTDKFVTAHGITKVTVIGQPGSNIILGDTSELNIDFKVRGSGTLKFAGTAAPDDFDISAAYDNWLQSWQDRTPSSGRALGYYGTPEHRAAMRLIRWTSNAPQDPGLENPPLNPEDFLVVPSPFGEQIVVSYLAGEKVILGQTLHPYVWAPPNSAGALTPVDYYAVPWDGIWYNAFGYFIGDEGHYLAPAWGPLAQLFYHFENPLYTISRTFGTNGRTQAITFGVEKVNQSSIILDGRGASDDYEIAVGLGSFLDIRIDDTDASTQNSLQVEFNDTNLLPHVAKLSDDSLRLEYYTPSVYWLDYQTNLFNLSTSVKYSPTIRFGANTDISLVSAAPFKHNVIDRPNAEQGASIEYTGFWPHGLNLTPNYMYSIYVPELSGETGTQSGLFEYFSGIGEIEVLNNAGQLSISTPELDYTQNFLDTRLQFSVHSNTGSIVLDAKRANISGSTPRILDIYSYDNEGDILVKTSATNAGPLTVDIYSESDGGLLALEIIETTQLYFPTINVHSNAAAMSVKTTQTVAASQNALPPTYNVVSNDGSIVFDVSQIWSPFRLDSFNVHTNDGEITINHSVTDSSRPDKYVIGNSHVVNILTNSGTVSLHDVVASSLINFGIDTSVNIGSGGSLAEVRGTINLSNSNGHYGLKIDNHLNSTSIAEWVIDYASTTIGDLTINYPGVNAPAPYLDTFSKFEAYKSASDSVTLINEPPPFFVRQLNGADFPGWQPNVPSFVVNQGGDVVNLQVEITGDPDGPLTYSASNLPAGLSINPTSGLISGTILPQTWLNRTDVVAAVRVNQGQSYQQRTINWFISSGIDIFADFPGGGPTLEGTPASFEITTTNVFNRPVTLSVNGLPPGLSFNPSANTVSGTVSVGAAQNGPYLVTVNATDGSETAVLEYTWAVTGINVQPIDFLINRIGDTVNFQIPATSVSGGLLHFEADENSLPEGLTLNPNTGVISGVISNDALSKFVNIAITQGNDINYASFLWTVLQPNEVLLPTPNGDGTFVTIQSSVGTTLEASISPNAGVALPAGWAFPFDFLTFTVTGLAPGAAADVTLYGLDTSLITDYYKYGATPANPSDHWYKFLFNQQTDADNAAGTGMEIVFGQIVLHLIDGGRGDDDLIANGVIQDIGGAAIAKPNLLLGDYNLNGTVDAADYVVWRYNVGQFVGQFTSADGDGDAYVDQGDYNVWRSHFGETTSPGAGAAVATMTESQASGPVLTADQTSSTPAPTSFGNSATSTQPPSTSVQPSPVARAPSAEQATNGSRADAPDHETRAYYPDQATNAEPFGLLALNGATTVSSSVRNSAKSPRETAPSDSAEAALLAWLSTTPEDQPLADLYDAGWGAGGDSTKSRQDSSFDRVDVAFELLEIGAPF